MYADIESPRIEYVGDNRFGEEREGYVTLYCLELHKDKRERYELTGCLINMDSDVDVEPLGNRTPELTLLAMSLAFDKKFMWYGCATLPACCDSTELAYFDLSQVLPRPRLTGR